LPAGLGARRAAPLDALATRSADVRRYLQEDDE
jgi:hypothetical protein